MIYKLPHIQSLPAPKIFGHRGSRQEGIYENSPSAFAAAGRHADGMETDAVISRDGEIFFVHDTLANGLEVHYELDVRLNEDSRNQVAGRRMDQMTAAEIRQLRLVNGEKLADFSDLLRVMTENPAFVANIEMKGDATFAPVAAYLDNHAHSAGIARNRFIFTSFNHPGLVEGHRRSRDYTVGPLYDAGNKQPVMMYPWSGNHGSYYLPFSLERLDDPLLRTMEPEFFSLNEYDLRPEILAAIRVKFPRARIMVWWWGGQTEPPPPDNIRLVFTLKLLEQQGVLDMLYAVITDFPQGMRKLLAEAYRKEPAA